MTRELSALPLSLSSVTLATPPSPIYFVLMSLYANGLELLVQPSSSQLWSWNNAQLPLSLQRVSSESAWTKPLSSGCWG